MRLKKSLSICAVLAIAASMTAGMQLSASAATQVGTPDLGTSRIDDMENILAQLNKAGNGTWSTITLREDGKTWNILNSQTTKNKDGSSDNAPNFGVNVSGVDSAYKFETGLNDNRIIYYSFVFMGASGNPGHYAINNLQLNGGLGLYIQNNYSMYAYYPERITVITDNFNGQTYYYSPDNSVSKATEDAYKTAIQIGARTKTGNDANKKDGARYFFNDFSYGTIDFAVNGSDTVTAGDSAAYTIVETGDSLGVGFTPANMALALETDVEGVTIDDGTLNVADTVADNTTVTINANINGTTVASKTVTISAPAASEPSATAEKIGSTTGTDDSVADVFYGTYTSNGDTTVNKINITVNGKTKSLSTTNLSGAGDVSFGVVISYADGNNKGYTPTFTVQ